MVKIPIFLWVICSHTSVAGTALHAFIYNIGGGGHFYVLILLLGFKQKLLALPEVRFPIAVFVGSGGSRFSQTNAL